ncbi:TIGR01212 family radical SAM protein [Mogibacterium pumilum]|uniref:TIGR01212 family radical SAM protein n=1 Tax=Mogibacterium pumilum TaxID=86332 RepID=A0A223ASV8_9FIRM|nr:TIGR01212 family radical SAM protein [Mogibacterium pumilum]ASS38066.1 TIGR01212 family radical SAM protein [Mogibacterium pumilum]
MKFTKDQRFYSINTFLKEQFGRKMVKLSIEAGFTCPNRDGKVGYGGCKFCSSGGSGELASNISDQIELLNDKWPNAGHLAYFQSHTNTYASVDVLREKYHAALSYPDIEGIVIATRPDCLDEEVLNLLSEISENHFMWIELGLQTIHDKTLDAMNIGYHISDFDRAMSELSKRNIKTVVHLILGLPEETEKDMFKSLHYVTNSGIFGIKMHLMNIVRTSPLYKEMPDYVSFDSLENYVDLVVRMLEETPPNITIHRLTGDVPRKLLVSPEWSYKKRTILNSINHELIARDTYQGAKLQLFQP